jgi:hypothetical protein
MRFYWDKLSEMQVPFGQDIVRNYLIPDAEKPYLCVYLQSELDAYVASKHGPRVGQLMAARYINAQVVPFLQIKGEVLLSEEYP